MITEKQALIISDTVAKAVAQATDGCSWDSKHLEALATSTADALIKGFEKANAAAGTLIMSAEDIHSLSLYETIVKAASMPKENLLAMLNDREVQEKIWLIMDEQINELRSQAVSLTCQLHSLQNAQSNWVERFREAVNGAKRAHPGERLL